MKLRTVFSMLLISLLTAGNLLAANLGGTGLNSSGAALATQTSFTGGVTIGAAEAVSSACVTDETVSIAATINAAQADVGATVDLLLLAIYTPPAGSTMTFINNAGAWEMLGGNIPAYQSGTSLAATQTVTVWEGSLAGLPGALQIHVGYRKADGSIIYNATPIQVNVSEAIAEADYTLQLLHFADVDGNDQTALNSVDEFSALVNAFKNDSTYGAATLLVSSGDNIIPGPRFYAAEQSAVKAVTGSDEPGHADIALLNALGVQASAVGNHELDAGPAELADAIRADDSATATFPYLAVNIDWSGESDFGDGRDVEIGVDGSDVADLAGQVARYAVVNVNGETIGLVGAAYPNLDTITTTGSLTITPDGDWTTAALVTEIQGAVDALTAEGINKIIVLAHMQQISVEKELAGKLRNVDIIVAGGSNTRMGDATDSLFPGDAEFAESYPYQTVDADGKPLLVVNVDGDYKYLGRLVVGFDADGTILPCSLNQNLNGSYAATESLVAAVGGTAIEEVVAVRDAVQSVITAQYGNVLGYAAVYLDGRRSQVRTQETNLGDLTADANLWYANLMSDEYVHVSIKNGGGIRTEIGAAVVPPGSVDYNDAELVPPPANDTTGTDEGAISEGHLRATLKFDNGLVILKATATELKDLMEHAVAGTAPGATPGQFPQIAGMQIGFDSSETARTTNGTGSRIRNLVVLDENGSASDTVVEDGVIQGDPNRIFRLVTLNFLAEGGDNYPFSELAAYSERLNMYEGLGYGESIDYDDADLSGDPGLNSSFSYTGGEQDALTEYLMQFHPDSTTAYKVEEADADQDLRIQDLSIRAEFEVL